VSVAVLEIQRLWHVGMNENVVTAVDAYKPEAKRFDEYAKVAKSHVLLSRQNSPKKLSLVHRH
jgi:hypothetical protein